MAGEFDPAQHEREVSERFELLGRVALFDELIDYALDGTCTMEEAIAQYKHDVAVGEQDG